MSKEASYIIQHINLETYSYESLKVSTAEFSYYLIFWWKDIPLGDLYFERDTFFEKAEFQEKILDAIHKTIEHYVAKLNLEKFNYSKGSLDDRRGKLAVVLDAVAAAHAVLPILTQVDISVVICTRNRTTNLKACLDSLAKLASNPREIIVVDNAPTDDETRKLVTLYKNVTYCHEPRKGLDIARNTGAYLAKSSIVAYIDDDVCVHPLWASRIWESFLDPKIAAITSLVFAAGLHSEAQQLFEKYWGFNKGYIEKVYDNDFFKSSGSPPVWKIGAGASMAFRKSILELTGYFDERLDVGAAGCNGDSEMWYRILFNGYDILYNPRVIIYHSHRLDLAGLKKQLFNYLKGHVVASLIQQKENRSATYHRYVYWELPKYYLLLLKSGFPSFSSRYRTLFSEISGMLSGVLYFFKHRHTPPNKL